MPQPKPHTVCNSCRANQLLQQCEYCELELCARCYGMHTRHCSQGKNVLQTKEAMQ